MSRRLAELLVKDRVITAPQFADAERAAKTGKSYIRHLIETKSVSETKLLYYLGQKFSLPSINLSKFEVAPEILKLIPTDLARKFQVIPIQKNNSNLVVAVCDPSDLSVMENLKFTVKTNIEVVLTSYSVFDAAMMKYYGGAASMGTAIESFQKSVEKEGNKEINIDFAEVHSIDTASESDAPVIAFVNGILSECVRLQASDIHIEPYERRFRIRMRIDGILQEVAQVPMEMRRAVVARVKIMARMDIAESRIPQDGRIKLKIGVNEVDFRVSSMPTIYGEKVVLRLLSKANLQLDLAKLGFEQKQLEVFKKGIYSANGLILVTGPTGSGKTTTLYSALIELNKVSDNVSTVEDPVEYNLEGINQTQVHKDIGLSFANVLRSLLRQDPDIVLVGEVRDYETAEVVVQAALTGHLVLSTLHTNDAVSSITRLMNMGLEPFLVTASVNTIVAQRLLRVLCPKCKVEDAVPKEKLIEIGFPKEHVDHFKLYKGKGCTYCNNRGYKGRVAIYEVLDFTPNLKEMVLRGASVMELKRQAIAEGMKPLRMAALTKVAEGVTSITEALSLTMET